MAFNAPMRIARGFSPGRLLRVLYAPKAAFTAVRRRPTHLDWIVPSAAYSAIALVAVHAVVGTWPHVYQLLFGAPMFLSVLISLLWGAIGLLVVFNVFLGREIGFRAALIIFGYVTVLDSVEIVAIAVPMAVDSSYTPDTTLSRLVPAHLKETILGKILSAADLGDLWRTYLYETGTTVMAGQEERRWAVIVVLWALWTAVAASGLKLTF